MFPCPSCKHLVSVDQRFCGACALAFRHEPPDRIVPVYPQVRPGATIAAADFRVANMPAYNARSYKFGDWGWFEPHPAGIMVTLMGARAPTFPNFDVRVRDGCVRARFTVLDPGARIGVVARRSPLTDARVGYAADCSPDRRSVWLRRVFDSNEYADSETLWNKAGLPEVKPVGVMTVVELRVLGPTIAVAVDDVVSCTVHDPTYGIGNFGLRVARESDPNGRPVRILCHGYDITEVAR